jgi:hypothetical protein
METGTKKSKRYGKSAEGLAMRGLLGDLKKNVAACRKCCEQAIEIAETSIESQRPLLRRVCGQE